MKYILISMICFGGTFLVYENTHFVMSQGIPLALAFLVALTLEGFCLLASAYRAWVLAVLFLVLVLFVSSYNRLSPILDTDGMSRAQTLRVETLNKSVEGLERELEIFGKQGQPKNTARVSRELNKKRAERDAAVQQISAAPMAVLSMATMAGDIVGIIFLRLFVQMSSIFCAEKLGSYYFVSRRKPKKPNKTKMHHVVQKASDFIGDRGAINRQKMLESKQFSAADCVDLTTDLLAAMGKIEIQENGKKANTVYSIT